MHNESNTVGFTVEQGCFLWGNAQEQFTAVLAPLTDYYLNSLSIYERILAPELFSAFGQTCLPGSLKEA